MSDNIIHLNENVLKNQLGELVRGTIEETLNNLLDQEADRLTNASRYEHTESRKDTRAGCYNRKLLTKAGAGEVPVCKFILAVDRNFKNSEGERDTDFLPIVVWRKLTEICAENLSKGRMVAVTGRIQVRNWEYS